jgi:tetratricopeptide (TPR) repeat protein
MRNSITRIAMILIAFGFFISCTQTFQSLDNTASELSTEELLNRAQEMRTLNPNDPVSYHYEGIAYMRLARLKAPDNRESEYRSMRSSFDAALQLYGNSRTGTSEQSSIEDLKRSTWSNEHNSAAGLFMSDSTANRQRLDLAAAHVKNAIIIIPDSLISYELLAEIYVKAGNVDEAILVLESVNQGITPETGRIFEHIGYLYYHKNEFSNAVTWYEEAVNWHQNQNMSAHEFIDASLHKGSFLNARHGLVNAYIANQQIPDAISALNSLKMEYPLNESYSRMLTNQYLLLLDEYLNTDINDTRELAVIDEYLGELSANSEKSPDIELDVALNLIDIGNRFSDARYTEDESFNLQSVPEVVKTIQFAITMLNRIIEIDPENYSAISGLAEAYILIGNESEAAIWYDRLER